MNSFWQGFRDGFAGARLDDRTKGIAILIGGALALAALVLT